MEVHNPQLLPPEIIRLADYFGVRRLVALRQDPRQGERERQGRLGTESDGAVTLFLNRICRHGLTSSTPKASLWLMLLDTLLHEAGHTRQPWRTAAEYRNSVKGWGYWQCYAERDARCFAERELLRLADLDEDLWMPSHNRGWGYLGARLSRVLAWRAAEARQAEGFPVRVMLAIWAAKLNAGDHVR
ncbi:MAG: hypothetical protein H8D78_02105 [Chloroflexi bacterium]|nr:hypothetical protein [Chloroflexota bacterium]